MLNDSVTEPAETAASTIGVPEPIHSEPRAPWASAIALAEAGLLADVSIVFDLAWIYVPILGNAFVPLIPTPFTILYLRRGPRISLFAACVAGFLMTVLVGPHYGWRLALEACIGMAMGWAMQRRWSPLIAITLGLFVNTTVAYVAAFAAVLVLGLPLHDLYLEMRNLLLSVDWLLTSTAILTGQQAIWHNIRPGFAAVGTFSLAHWIPMFYAYVAAIALPTDVLFYGVASSTAFALGHDVKPFPPPWVWRALRVVGIMLSPLFWLVRLAWRVVTAPLWGPAWVAQAVSRRRRTRRLSDELSALRLADAAPASPPIADDVAASEAPEQPLETSYPGEKVSQR